MGTSKGAREYFPLALAVLLVMAAIRQASACSDPADTYAVEVVLNAPGTEYELSALAGAAAISYAGGTAYAYRSRYDSRLVVVVSEQELKPGSGSKHLAVRVQVPVATKEYRVYRCTLLPCCSWLLRERVPLSFTAGEGELTLDLGTLRCDTACWVRFKPRIKAWARANATLLVSGRLALKGTPIRRAPPETGGVELEYRVSMPCLLSLGEPCVRILVLIPGYDAPLRIEAGEYRATLTLHWHASAEAEGVLERVEVECSCLKVAPAEEPVRDLGWRAEEGGELVKRVGDLAVRVSPAGGGLTVLVESPRELNARELEEVLQQLGGVVPSPLKICNFTVSVESRIVPCTEIGESEVKAALKAELEWLVESGVVRGLGRGEIERIVSAAKLGYAGWNQRLVWYEGEWVPYSSVPGAALVRCLRGIQPAFQAESREYAGLPQAPSREGAQAQPAHETPLGEARAVSRALSWLQTLAIAALVALAAAALSYVVVKRAVPA